MALCGPSPRESGLPYARAACDSALSRIWLTPALTPLSTPFCPQSGGNQARIQHSQTEGLDDARQGANNAGTPEFAQVLYAADKQVCSPFNILLNHKTTCTKDFFSSTPQMGLENTCWVYGGHNSP